MQDEMEQIDRIAKEHKIKVTAICKYLECSRASYYNWLAGTPVIAVYQTKIKKLYSVLMSTCEPKEAFELERRNS